MAGTKKPRRNERRDPRAHAESVVRNEVKPGARVVLGLSGGVDSVVLLAILDELRGRLDFSLAALHIDHQISLNSRDWERFCAALCAGRDIPYNSARVTPDSRGSGTEAAAREARYRVFAQQSADFIALGQNQDDQAETLLLQLLRGAGVRGLSAMPVMRDGWGRTTEAEKPGTSSYGEPLVPRSPRPAIIRPLLAVPRSEILSYAQAHDLRWIDDESNQNTAYDRNFLRHRVLPEIESRFAGYRETLSRTTTNLADAAGLLDELAQVDLGAATDNLEVGRLRSLPPSRAGNLLRFWLRKCGIVAPNRARLEEALRQLLTARSDRAINIELVDFELHRFRDRVYATPVAKPGPPWEVEWRDETRVALPGSLGYLEFERTLGSGVSLAALAPCRACVRLRRGGERLQPDPRRPRRTLKNLLQEAGMPPWERRRLPLLWCGDRLIWAAGIGVDAAFRCEVGQIGVTVRWVRQTDAPG